MLNNRLHIKILNVFCLLIFSFGILNAQSTVDRIVLLEDKLEKFSKVNPQLDELVTISLNGSIQEMVSLLAESTTINISIKPEIKGQVSNTFSNAPVKEILVYLCDAHSLDLKFTGSIIQMVPYIEKPKVTTTKPLEIDYDKAKELFTLNLKGDTLSAVAQKLSQFSGQSIVLAPEVRDLPVNGFINQVSIAEAVEQIALNNDLELGQNENYFLLKDKVPEVVEPPSGGRPGQSGTRNTGSGNKPNDGNYSDLTVIKSGSGKVNVVAINAPIADVITRVAEVLKTDYYLLPEQLNSGVGVNSNNRNNSSNRNNADNANTGSRRQRTNFQGSSSDLVSCNLKSVDFKTVIEHLSKNSSYSFKEEAGIFIIGRRGAEGLRSTRVIPIKYRSAKGVVDFIPSEMLTGVELDTLLELNSLILSGSEKNIAEVDTFLQEIDKLVPMIMIELIIVDVQNNMSREFGIEAGLTPGGKQEGGTIISSTTNGTNFTFSPNAINRVLRLLAGSNVINLGQVSNDFFLSLKAIEEKGLIEIKSTPKLSTLNSHDANLSIGQKRYYLEQQVNFPGDLNPIPVQSNTFQEVEANLDIDIRPFVSGDEQVTLEIFFEQSEFIAEVAPNEPPPQVTRRFESMVRMKNGEMIVLGGLERETKSNTRAGVPFLSRIPVIGWLFGKKRKSKSKDKLLIFVRPTIIN